MNLVGQKAKMRCMTGLLDQHPAWGIAWSASGPDFNRMQSLVQASSDEEELWLKAIADEIFSTAAKEVRQ